MPRNLKLVSEPQSLSLPTEGHILACEDVAELVEIARNGSAIEHAMRLKGKWTPISEYYRVARAFLWAEWQAGHQLRLAERSKGGRPGKNSYHDNKGFLVLIDENKIDTNMAYRWMSMSWAPRDIADAWMKNRQEAGTPLKRSELIKIGKRHKPLDGSLLGEGYEIIHADLLNADIADASIDCIITDPPYPREFIGEYAKLSQFASRVLKPGGSCLAMAGQSYLPEVIPALASCLTYNWMVAYLTPGGQSVQQWDRQVNTFWKPVLWYVKGEYHGEWIGDVVKSDVNDNDKRFHHWGQSESGTARLIEKFSRPDHLICDPFLGGATTAIAALAKGRRFIGVDKDKIACADALARIEAFNYAIEASDDIEEIA